MTTATASQMPPVVALRPIAKAAKTSQPKKITWEEFEARYLVREDKYKYEWVDGLVIKTPREMNQIQSLIWRKFKNLLLLLSNQKGAPMGEFMQEVDTFFGKSHRRPDIAYFSEAQLAAIPTGNQVPQFVIEIISKTDQMALVHLKMQDYRRAEVKVVWHIFPELQEVHVYHGDQMTICRGEKLCSASPVLPDFEMAAQDIFQ
ncbi:MAG: Uma2 family endonuclease [Phycisphaerae bacterium]|nr:Uma2 family endonuclease [Saprospiraceae bacterium]